MLVSPLWIFISLAAASPAPQDSIIARVDSLFESWRAKDSPGCAVGVSSDGRVILERAYGMANIESGFEMTPSTVVHAASLAKSITAMSVMLLVRDGKISLDDDVRRFLPDLPDYRKRYGKSITVRQLLNHTSGLRDFFEMLILARGQFEEQRITDLDAMTIIKRQQSLNFAPGSQYTYSNTGYLLAAKIVERVSGQSFRDFTSQRIFVPLGMRHTQFRADFPPAAVGSAEGYARKDSGWRISVPNFDVVGSTNLQTTVGDLLIWAKNLDHPAIGDSSVIQQMTTPTIVTAGDTTTYGLGLSLQRDRDMRVIEHEGRDPGFRAYLGWYPERKVAVALLCNAAALDPVGLGRKVAAVTLGLATSGTSPLPVTTANGAIDTKKWAGVYFEPSTRQVAELTLRDGVLYTNRIGGARVEAINAQRARLVGQPLELEFGKGSHPGYQVRWLIPGRRVDSFEWRAPKAPELEPGGLATYAGTYHSTDLDATYNVEVKESTLALRTGNTPALIARPVFPDAFVSGQYTIQFIRSRGRITGFEISHPRARGLRFERVTPR